MSGLIPKAKDVYYDPPMNLAGSLTTKNAKCAGRSIVIIQAPQWLPKMLVLSYV